MIHGAVTTSEPVTITAVSTTTMGTVDTYSLSRAVTDLATQMVAQMYGIYPGEVTDFLQWVSQRQETKDMVTAYRARQRIGG